MYGFIGTHGRARHKSRRNFKIIFASTTLGLQGLCAKSVNTVNEICDETSSQSTGLLKGLHVVCIILTPHRVLRRNLLPLESDMHHLDTSPEELGAPSLPTLPDENRSVRVFIRPLSGENFMLLVAAEDTIGDFKEMIAVSCGACTLRCLYGGDTHDS